jgi:hypothetical protein
MNFGHFFPFKVKEGGGVWSLTVNNNKLRKTFTGPSVQSCTARTEMLLPPPKAKRMKSGLVGESEGKSIGKREISGNGK